MKTSIVLGGLNLSLKPGYENQGDIGQKVKITDHWSVDGREACYRDYHFITTRNDKTAKPLNLCVRGLHEKGAHTYMDNTGNIGHCFNGMTDAVESPFHPGPFPITDDMIEHGAHLDAELMVIFGMPDPRTNERTHMDHYLRSLYCPGYEGVGYGKWDMKPYWEHLHKAACYYFVKLKDAIGASGIQRQADGIYLKSDLAKLGVFENLDIIYGAIAGKTSFD